MKKINLFDTLKAKGVTLEDSEKKMLDEVSAELNDALKDATTSTEVTKAIEDAIKKLPAEVSAKTVKVEGSEAENLNEHLRKMGEEIAELKKNDNQPTRTKTLQDHIEEKWAEIEKIMKNKSGFVDITMKAAVVMSTANTIDVSGLNADNLGAEKIADRGLVLQRRNREYIFDIADRQIVADLPEVIRWDEEGDEEGAFAIVAEGALKPLVSLSLVRNESEKKKAAGKIVVTEELMKFRPRLYSRIRTLFDRKVTRDYENILTTSLVTAAASYVGTDLDGTIDEPNDYHAIGAVAAQLETLEFAPDVLIINPQDKWRIALTTDSNGQFMTNLPITGANGQVQFMSFRVVTTNKIAAGTAILGEGNAWKIEQENVTMRIGYGVTMNGSTAESDFDHNRIRIIGELYFHEYISTIDAGSFVEFEFDTVKLALKAP